MGWGWGRVGRGSQEAQYGTKDMNSVSVSRVVNVPCVHAVVLVFTRVLHITHRRSQTLANATFRAASISWAQITKGSEMWRLRWVWAARLLKVSTHQGCSAGASAHTHARIRCVHACIDTCVCTCIAITRFHLDTNRSRHMLLSTYLGSDVYSSK